MTRVWGVYPVRLSSQWDAARLRVRAVVTRLSDLQPLELYESAQTHGDEILTSFGPETMPWLEPAGSTFGDMDLRVDLIDDVGVLHLQFLRINNDGNNEEIRREDVLRYLECLAPWR